MNVICLCYLTGGTSGSIWFTKNNFTANKKTLLQFLEKYKYGTFVAFNAQAEARAIHSLGIDPLKYRFIDLFFEYRSITNNSSLMYGKHLYKDKVITTTPPTYPRDINETISHARPQHHLASAVYKMLGKKIDLKIKDQMRDLILSQPKFFSPEQKENIIKYCHSDVEHLPDLFREIFKFYQKKLPIKMEKIYRYAIGRGRDACRSAIMQSIGYPVHLDALDNISSSVDRILSNYSRKLNTEFPQILPFNYHPYRGFTFSIVRLRIWCHENHKDEWPKTDKGTASLSITTWRRMYPDPPEDSFPYGIKKYLSLRQSLGGLKKKNPLKKTIFDSIGSDGRVRPYLNPYGSQTGRFQPSTVAFLPLKPSWQRSLIRPPYGRIIISCDYSSEEYFISALLSKDRSMIDAYLEGDVYLDFAIRSKEIPAEGTKETHPIERQRAKACVLGISYGMSKIGLSKRLNITERQAEAMIQQYGYSYPSHYYFKKNYLKKYENNRYAMTPCGYVMFGENQNPRSIQNFAIQGFGASILRKAIANISDNDIDVIFPLHDAIYVECDFEDLEQNMKTIRQCMLDAFVHYFDDEKIKKLARKVRLDFEVWGDSFPTKEKKTMEGYGEVLFSQYPMKEGGEKTYKNFKKYFTKYNDFFS